jgi:hypothetical protein
MRNLMKPNTPTATEPAPQLVTPRALCERWKVSNMFLWRARRDGKLPSFKLGGKHVRYLLSDVERFEEQSRA